MGLLLRFRTRHRCQNQFTKRKDITKNRRSQRTNHQKLRKSKKLNWNLQNFQLLKRLNPIRIRKKKWRHEVKRAKKKRQRPLSNERRQSNIGIIKSVFPN